MQCTNGTSVFYGLHGTLRAVLQDRLGWSGLREVQEQAYAAVCRGSDVLVIAPTAGGKTESALIPVMDKILKSGAKGVACLYISPLKALINDQEDRFFSFCVPAGLSFMKWHGDVPRGDRGWDEGEAPHFLMITPESLEVLLQEKNLCRDLENLRYVIVDELHAFVESERGVHLRVLLARLDRLSRAPLQRIGLSATVGNPREVLSWLSDDRGTRELVAVPAPAAQRRFLFIVENDPGKRIEALARIVSGKKALVFVSSRSAAETIVQEASGRIRNLHIHHSSISPALKKTAEDSFHSDEGACIVCTGTLELGIDIGDLDIVVQAGPPDSVSSFLQRMGRSGRREQSAFVAWLLSDPGELLTSCAIVECAMNREVEPLVPPGLPYTVFLQQVFLFVHAQPRLGRNKLVADLLSVPAFSRITRMAAETIIDHLVRESYLVSDDGMLMPGERAEREFCGTNGKNLYSVIAGGGEYRAITPDGEVVGSLDEKFVSRQAAGNAGDFLLGGKNWSVISCDEGHNLVVVVPGSGGAGRSRVFWTAADEPALSPIVSSGVQRIAARGTVLPLPEDTQEHLAAALGAFPSGITEQGIFVREEKGPGGNEVAVYSFHGARFNRVLALLLQKTLGHSARIRYNDFCIRVRGAGKEGAAAVVADAIRAVPGLPASRIQEVLPVPPHETWKFARALPPAFFRDMVLSDYYHIDRFNRILAEAPVHILPKKDGACAGRT
ncbi:MAG: DEAD/DEAH box helicase [Methanoregula sp.]|nr:DEAD/DEAH box helicase [Methanoregula sp.]